ncbi:protein of unknown function [Burkholderia multivorans]
MMRASMLLSRRHLSPYPREQRTGVRARWRTRWTSHRRRYRASGDAFGLQPHRQDTFKLSSDSLFVNKVRDIVGLYLDPPLKAMVLCVDEKSQNLTVHDRNRAWKSFDWDVLNRPHERGLIGEPVNKAKSVILTEEGLRESERLFKQHFVTAGSKTN